MKRERKKGEREEEKERGRKRESKKKHPFSEHDIQKLVNLYSTGSITLEKSHRFLLLVVDFVSPRVHLAPHAYYRAELLESWSALLASRCV